MPLLCFGGTFNPVHHGHLICARAAAEAGGFDKIILIPAGQPPHKQGDTNVATAHDRLAMCRLAVADDPMFELSDLEIHRTGPSYTIDTARRLRTTGWPEVNWLIGADMLAGLPHWHQAAALLAEVHFVVMARPGWSLDWSTMPRGYRDLQQHVVSSPSIDISSTDIRNRVANGKSIDYLSTPSVVRYIHQAGLYRQV